MSALYNQVTPLALGKLKSKSPNSENNKKKNKNSKEISSQLTAQEDPYDPLQTMIGDSLIEAEKRKRRAERFQVKSRRETKRIKNTFDPLQEQEDFSNLNAIGTKSHAYDQSKTIIGKCTTLEKRYLRLTSEPNPEFVRPLPILNKAFKFIMGRYARHEVNYTYICDQLKSIRQDMRVQMIENKFTMKVYQTHARLALENGDLGEFNQCQSRLFILYSKPDLKKTSYSEFVSYLILYFILTENFESITSWRLKLIQEDIQTFQEQRVQKSFQLSQNVLLGDYSNSLSIAKSINGVATNLVSPVIERERLKALMIICQSYNQLNIKYMVQLFRFHDQLELITYLKEKQLDSYIAVKNPNTDTEFRYLDTKNCKQKMKQIYDNSRKVDIKGQI
ncbi:Thp3p PWA37_004513 [Arxiozyma heterogenica]|uniref:SAC3/GANP/THP3 conserved domain-containing protein n=1 Tax=Arxiozyma heterogenica TaxID=278026 RepID=A0AAN7WTX5_9SACH|nr:hypothetical protein RI543_000800 [Kazachstania heterogenica]